MAQAVNDDATKSQVDFGAKHVIIEPKEDHTATISFDYTFPCQLE